MNKEIKKGRRFSGGGRISSIDKRRSNLKPDSFIKKKLFTGMKKRFKLRVVRLLELKG